MFKMFKWGAVILLYVLSLNGINTLTASAPVDVTAAEYQQVIEPTAETFTQLYQAVSPSVVAIHVTSERNGQITGGGTGSGFVIDQQGHIVTNNHVVSDADTIEIEFFDGLLASADVVGLDPASDLAVLAVDIPTEQLIPVTFGDSDALLVGESVLAIGSPYGQDWTLTTGIISGLNRLIGGLTDFSIGGVIQTDAAINPGNSGGPLLNLNGQVVGVNSQILSESGSNSGVGFAIPSNLVQRVAQELIADGGVDYSYIGISGTDVSLAMLQELGITSGSVRGVLVAETVPNSPADLGGLQNANLSPQAAGNFDIITAVNGVAIKGMDDLVAFLARETIPTQTITLTVLRNGTETIDLAVTLTARP
jgi:S1-C subfamily serine protease